MKQALKSRFSDLRLFHRALSHRSISPQASNERLEFLGDAVLKFAVSSALYQAYPKAQEGLLTRAQMSLVSGDHLTRCGQREGIDALIRFANNHLAAPTPAMIENAVEAIIGALFLDGGLSEAVKFIHDAIIGPLPLAIEDLIIIDPKTQLQELLQSKSIPLPVYRLVDAIDSNQPFNAQCIIKQLSITGFGAAQTKRAAEQQAAYEALCQIRKNK